MSHHTPHSVPNPAPITVINIDVWLCVPFIIVANFFLISVYSSVLQKRKPDPPLDETSSALESVNISPPHLPSPLPSSPPSSSSSTTSSPPLYSFRQGPRHPFISPSTAVAVRSQSHVVIASFSRTNSDLYGMSMEEGSHLGIIMAGMMSHRRLLSNYIKACYNAGSPVPVTGLLSHIAVKTKQLWGEQSYMVGFLVAGWDDSGSHLYSNVPDGRFIEYRNFATGQNSEAALTYLEESRSGFGSATREEVIMDALHALKETLQGEALTASNCTVSVVGAGEAFHILNKETVQKLIDDFDTVGEEEAPVAEAAPAEETFSLSLAAAEMAGGSGRVQVNESHKTRFASKYSRNLHKTTSLKVLKEKRACSGTTSPPSVIVLFGLSASVNLNPLEDDLSTLLASSEYKLRTMVLKAPRGDLLSCMEMAKVADLIAFVASANSYGEGEDTSNYMDSFGSQCLSVFRALGLPSTVVLIRDLPDDLKKRHEAKKICTSSLVSEFPNDCKFYPADKKEELHKFMRIFREQRLTVPHWRNQRPYLVAQKVEYLADADSSEKCTLLLTGYLHARNLSVNQLVHVSGAGDFQLLKIDLLKDPCPLNRRKESDLMDSDQVQEVIGSLTPDSTKQEALLAENTPDPFGAEQTWPAEEKMEEADKTQKEKKLRKKNLPTYDYQAAWIVDDSDLDDSDCDGDPDDSMVLDENDGDFIGRSGSLDLDEDQVSVQLRDSDEETEADSVMMEGENLTKEQIEDDIRKIKELYAEDEEFPDEIDTPIDIPAQKRFAKYRGMKSLRTSSWDPSESLPPDYAKIFVFDNFKRTQKHVFAKALEMEEDGLDECIAVGSYLNLCIKEVPISVATKLCTLSKKMPIIACGLLQHESKISVLHFSVKKHETFTDPIKSKEELLFHVGFRQFVCRPIFSSDSINSDKHKLERFLHAGRFSIASIYAPISFPPLPLVVLKNEAVVAVGSLRNVDPDRIALKKIVLTGYPQRVSKLKSTVRYMFHNPDDVKWFKPVEIWTKCGRRGRIKESIGTHGAMKVILNGVLQQSDTVCMDLFKRSYPKWPQRWYPLLDA